MSGSEFTGQERRRHRRFSPEGVRVWCVSGEFEELYTTVNFAKRLLNVSLEGLCVETTGRLRPQVKMSVEARFDKLGGTLRSEARIVWAETAKEGGLEVHKAGLKFVGSAEITRPVRDYLEGENSGVIEARRRSEYAELKRNSEARKQTLVPKKGSFAKKASVFLLIMVLLYVGSFWGFVFAGKRESPGPAIHYRYWGKDSKGGAEETLVRVYSPLVFIFTKIGIELAYDPP